MTSGFRTGLRTQSGHSLGKLTEDQCFHVISSIVHLMCSQWSGENRVGLDASRRLRTGAQTRHSGCNFGNIFGNKTEAALETQRLQQLSPATQRMPSPYNPTFQVRRRRFGEVAALGGQRAAR